LHSSKLKEYETTVISSRLQNYFDSNEFTLRHSRKIVNVGPSDEWRVAFLWIWWKRPWNFMACV